MYSEKLKKYPITSYLDEICGTLKKSTSRFLILTAETAAGKSTILPLGLLENFSGKIIMTEPRRLAVLGVANRVAELNGDECGKTIGYKIHLENKISTETRFEVVTEAILVRQLQSDPMLEDYNVVVLDEFHERSINTDLALAFLKEAMEVREDLYVIIMSATIDTDKIQTYLGNQTPVMKIPGRQFPVDVIYKDNLSMEQAILNEVNVRSPENGTILAFIPSIKEIRKVESNIKDSLPPTAILRVLHSSISLHDQKEILSNCPTTGKRIILSSAIAETSLTVPGVYCVIDSGYSRINRMNVATGMENLSTEVESEFSAQQRCGRAGRLQNGKCIRLWSEANPRIKNIPSEILRTDLTSLVLECAERGVENLDKIDWLEKPVEASWNASNELLKKLGMLDEKNHITNKGKAALTLGIHPRLANIALETGNLDLVIKYSSYNQSAPEIQKKFKNDLENRIKRSKFQKNSVRMNEILYGFPDRIAYLISEIGKNPKEYQFENGRKALLYEDKGRAGKWIVAPEVIAGDREGIIFEFENIENMVNDWLPFRTSKKIECSFENGKIIKEEKTYFGQIELASKRMPSDASDYAQAWCGEIKKKGINCLPKDKNLELFFDRASFWFQEKGEKTNGDSLEEYLIQKVNEWLPPFITTGKLTSEIVYNAVYWFLNGTKIDSEVPAQIILQNGNKCKVRYEKVSSPEDRNKLIIRPVIEIIIQRAIGCTKTPEICGMKVLMRLLSPANRPLQITDDLEGFWTGAWPEICKEMKGKYPKWEWE